MLAEERFSRILTIIEENGSATVQQLMIALGASESTIRRDLNAMDTAGLLTKVHGGAVTNKPLIRTFDEDIANRKAQNTEEKLCIAKYAAKLILPNDFVYIDAGSTTELLIDFIEAKHAVFVTNAIGHAKKLAAAGCRVYLLGGEFKSATESIVGEEAVASLDKYNFTKGFWGANGISEQTGLTTPDVKEALVKKTSMGHCKERYVLADSSKFMQISSIKFAEFTAAEILSTNVPKSMKKYKHIKEVNE